MNRRRHPRQPISLSALVHPATGRSWLCTVRDFCRQGMLLTANSAATVSGASQAVFAHGAEVAVHFSVPGGDGGQEHFRTRATVARVLESSNGIGVFFEDGLPERAFKALIEFAVASGMLSRSSAATVVGADGAKPLTDTDVSPAPTGETPGAASVRSDATPGGAVSGAAPGAVAETLRDRRIGQRDAQRVCASIRLIMERALQQLSDKFLSRAGSELLVSARDARTNTVQMMFFEGLDLIEKRGEELLGLVSEDVLRQLDTVSSLEEVLARRERRERGDSAKLEVVDTELFENWLAAADIIASTESRYSHQLLDLRARMGLLAKPWAHKDALPVGPAVITWAFDDVMRPLDMQRQVRQDLYRYFQETLIVVLGKAYEALEASLTESQVFPPLDEIREPLTRSSIRRSPSGVRVDQAGYASMEPVLRQAVLGADGVPSVPRVDANPFLPASRRAGVAFDTARRILSSSRTFAGAHHALGERSPAGARVDETFDRDEILQALSALEAELGSGAVGDRGLELRLMDVLRERHGAGKGLTEEDRDALKVMQGLVEAMESDSYLTPGVRQWIRRLEITLHKLATRDPDFLRSDADEPHSAVRVLNQLARLGNARDVREGIDREVGRRVDALLQRVVQEFDRRPEIFAEVLDELNQLADGQSQAYRSNIERTIRASEGHQKLTRARRAVVRAVAGRLEQRALPDLVLKLLNPGWRNLLVHTHLRSGPDSHEWRERLELLDQLWCQLTGDVDPGPADRIEPEDLLKRIMKGLVSISFDPARRTPLIMALSEALIGDTAGERTPLRLVEARPADAAKLLGLDGLLPEADPQIESQDEQVRHSFEAAVQRARRIQVGEWLATADRSGRPLILTVAFVGDAASSFVLVNRKGVKSRELSLREMSQGLHEGRITLLDDYDLPLMERASQRMLETMHSELAFKASHDDLTQLLNRKEFERRVEDAIQRARANGLQHVLLFMDLDQFKIVNSTSGHTAGDELLKLISALLNAALCDVNALLGRLGGDEFGVLVENVSSAGARALAQRVLNAVRAERFEWDGREYALSASLGLVFIDPSTEGIDAVMQYADEACYAAKDAGRNRVQEYELSDALIRTRHGIMEWVTHLDKALNSDRLVLNCQAIRPAADARSGPLFSEILLTMLDETGDPMPPAEFIRAAETYQRMALIDRWVIERVLRWMADHRSRLDRLGGLAINVSGHSINDETFPDFVLQQFSETQAPTGKVCFEITETAAIANLENARDFMSRMKIIGCRFALDDFGTGLSSYSYLRNLPVDYVKIDGVFVTDIADNPGDYAVVRSINEIGHYMGKQTIAEYVENEAALAAVREIGVDFVQGYHIAKPCRLQDLQL